jgi:hypothetical protein
VCYRYTILSGRDTGGDGLRGEIVTEVSGHVPLLTATTTADVTRRGLPKCTVLADSSPVLSSCLPWPRSGLRF